MIVRSFEECYPILSDPISVLPQASIRRVKFEENLSISYGLLNKNNWADIHKVFLLAP